ncbi:hypothetical protein D7Y13_42395, partial [Corallococcus praedator]
MTDVWVHGRIEECQDGCPKFMKRDRVAVNGGAANARDCLTPWRIRTDLFGRSHNDRPIKFRYVDDETGRIVFRYDDETMLAAANDYIWTHGDALERVIAHSDAVLISDYDKGFLAPDLIQRVVGACTKKKIPCVADAKREPDLYCGAIIK